MCTTSLTSPWSSVERHRQPWWPATPRVVPSTGTPIINADEASHVVFLKRSMRPGFAGIENELLYDDKTVLLFGDAKNTLQQLVAAVTYV